MLKNRETYEIMTPETIGLSRNPDDAGRLFAGQGQGVGEKVRERAWVFCF